MARVVFANGSKALAHNNEDLFERWRLRREELPVHVRTSELERDIELFLPEVADITTIAEADELYAEAQDKSRIILDRLTRVNAQLKIPQPKAVVQTLHLERAELAAASRRVQAQFSAFKLARHKLYMENKAQENTGVTLTIAGLRMILDQRRAADRALYDYVERLIEQFGDVEREAK